MQFNTVKKRDMFFKYLESEGLDPKINKGILEVAPTTILSQSLLLVEKYGELYKQFLVTKDFMDYYEYPSLLKGAKGVVEIYRDDVFAKTDSEKLYLQKKYNTLLIQGQPEEAYSLLRSKQRLLFGDVCEIGDRDTKCLYNDLLETIGKYNSLGGKYVMCHDLDSKEGQEYYLIKRKR